MTPWTHEEWVAAVHAAFEAEAARAARIATENRETRKERGY